jgi:hypothetical protein
MSGSEELRQWAADAQREMRWRWVRSRTFGFGTTAVAAVAVFVWWPGQRFAAGTPFVLLGLAVDVLGVALLASAFFESDEVTADKGTKKWFSNRTEMYQAFENKYTAIAGFIFALAGFALQAVGTYIGARMIGEA